MRLALKVNLAATFATIVLLASQAEQLQAATSYLRDDDTHDDLDGEFTRRGAA